MAKELFREEVKIVQRSYFAMVPRFGLEDLLRNALNGWSNEERDEEISEWQEFNGFCTQETILRATILFNGLQPSLTYRKRFLQMIFNLVESLHWQVAESVWLASSECRQISQQSQDDEGYRTFFLDNSNCIEMAVSVLHEPSIISDGTTGLAAWDAGFYLVEWLAGQPDLVRNKRVLELGSGSGLSGLCICKLFSPRLYVFSDHHEKVLLKLRENLRLNHLKEGSVIQVADLDWATLTARESEILTWSPDVILAADISYDPTLSSCFFSALSEFHRVRNLTTPNGPLTILVAVKVRNEDTYQYFKTVADKFGWHLDDVSVQDVSEKCFVDGSYARDNCLVFRVVRSS